MEVIIIGAGEEIFPSGQGLFAFASPQCGPASGLANGSQQKRPCSQERRNPKTAGAVIVNITTNISYGQGRIYCGDYVFLKKDRVTQKHRTSPQGSRRDPYSVRIPAGSPGNLSDGPP